MENILQNLSPVPQSSPKAVQAHSQTEPVNPLQTAVDQLFMRFQAHYGHIWSSQFQSEELAELLKIEWGNALSEFGFDRVFQVAEYCFDQKPMPPTLVEFKRLCRPQMKDFGLPSADRAYREACVASHAPGSAKWSHPVVYWAGKRFGWVELFQGSFGAEKRFAKIYESLCKRVMSGEKFELPTRNPTALEHQQTLIKNRTVQEIQTARQCCSQLLQGFKEVERRQHGSM